MKPKRVIAAFFLSQILVAAAFAQSAEVLDMTPKHSAPLSGSVTITASRSQLPFGVQGSGKGLDATLGGTLMKDRIWFFASAEKSEPSFGSQYAMGVPTRAIDTKVLAQVGDRQNLAASFAATRASAVATPMTIPSSFLSLHYTGIVSSNMFFTANFSELRRSP